MTHLIDDHAIAQPLLDLSPDRIEQRIICAYICLLFAPQVGGKRVTTVGWLGSREIRLTETAPAETPPFRVEVYSHVTGTVLDSCGCFDFDDTELEAVVELVIEAGSSIRNGRIEKWHAPPAYGAPHARDRLTAAPPAALAVENPRHGRARGRSAR